MPVRPLLATLVALTIAGCAGPSAPPVRPDRPALPPVAETAARNASAMAALGGLLERCRAGGCGLPVARTVEVDTVLVDGAAVVARFSRDLGDAPVRPETAAAFERAVAEAVRAAYPDRPVRVETRGDALAALVPNAVRAPADRDAGRLFAPPVEGLALVRPADPARTPGQGLAGRHLALWPSHGWLYNAETGGWGWQRPRLFTSVEDLLTVGFVTRELAPMLERAGAVTLLPRERDPSPVGVVVDDGDPGYAETPAQRWMEGPAGFARRDAYAEGIDPFRLGTTRETQADSRDARAAAWRLAVPAPGPYAVHVSYASGPGRSDAVRYRVAHAGGTAEVLVNQQIGGGTWVYLGTFEFDAEAVVELVGGGAGTMSADAVRIGGGMGVVSRDGQTSGRPRWVEAGRYYEQFAGAPASVYNITGEADDYTDDYRSRGEWVNWLRGAPYGPTGQRDLPGLGVPVDAALAWHTDAGIDRDGVVGTLAIYNVPGMDSTRAFPNGASRLANRDLADGVQTQIVGDLRALYDADWRRRPMWDRAYSEATRPNVPTLLLELLSHQNYRDMRYALDPRFRFDAARAVYKGMGRFLAAQRGEPFVPQPLRPTHLAAVLDGDAVRLSWRPQPDPLEPDADPTGYVVYTRDGALGWDEGVAVDGTAIRVPAPPVGVVRSYRVAAANAGGEGRPSEAVAVARGPAGAPRVLVVDGFDRVAAPETVDRPGRVGFVDAVGVPEGRGVVAVGPQTVFDPAAEYENDGRPGWGASRGSLEGQVVMGNARDHAAGHALALLGAAAVSSASDEAVWDGAVDLGAFDAVDLALGLEQRTPWPDLDDARPPAFEALPEALRERLGAFLDDGGALVVSGAHWVSDAAADPASAAWLRDRLGVEADGVVEAPALQADGPPLAVVTAYDADRYAAREADALRPAAPGAAVVRRYGAGAPAAVAFGRTVSLGVPVGALVEAEAQAAVLRQALARALGR